MKTNAVARTKLGVYSCHSLRIAENQEQGKDRRRIFCPGLLKTISFFLFFGFLDFFYFFGFFFLFLFFWIFSDFETKKFLYLPQHEGVLTFISRERLNLRAFSQKCFSEFYHAKVFRIFFLPHKSFKISNFTTQGFQNSTTQGF